MAITSVQVFKASDGRQFDTRELAESYERASVRVNSLRKIFSNGKLTQVAPILAPDLFNNPDLMVELRTELSKALDYHYKYGKLKGKPRPK